MKTIFTLITAVLMLDSMNAKSQLITNENYALNGILDNNKVVLSWTAGENENAQRFEVERSNDGINFISAGLVFTTEKLGEENYVFWEKVSSNKIMYRVKVVSKNQKDEYSRMLVLQNKSGTKNNYLKLSNNPVAGAMAITYESTKKQAGEINVYDMNGSLKINYKIGLLEGHNVFTIPLTANLKTGVYSVQLVDEANCNPIQFVKL